MGTSDSKIAFHYVSFRCESHLSDPHPRSETLWQGITALAETDVSEWSDEQWGKIWESNMPHMDVFQMISPSQVRDIRRSKSSNLKLLIVKVVLADRPRNVQEK